MWFVECDSRVCSICEIHSPIHLLPSNELSAILTNKSHKAQLLAWTSRLLQRELIHTIFQLSHDRIKISRTSENKPYFVPPQNALTASTTTQWNFNVSHDDNIVVIVSDFRKLIGVDVISIYRRPRQRHWVNMKPDEHYQARQAFFKCFHEHVSASEWRYILQSDKNCSDNTELCRDELEFTRFYQIWSLKEAYLKAHGIGLAYPFKQCTFEPTEEAKTNNGSGHWKLRLKGKLFDQWNFRCDVLIQKYIVSVARGPFEEAMRPESISLVPTHFLETLMKADTKSDSEQWRKVPLEALIQPCHCLCPKLLHDEYCMQQNASTLALSNESNALS